MAGDRPRYGPLLCTFGAVVLAVSAFLPWYGVSITAHGLAYIQQVGSEFASQYGNTRLQGEVGLLHSSLSGLAGHQLGALSARQALTHISVVLLIIAGIGILIAQISLIAPQLGSSGSHDGLLALLGALAAALVLYRIIHPPLPENSYIAVSLREGSWLALLGALAMVFGGLWPRRLGSRTRSHAATESVWSGLSGWTPES
jgi:hypothetical protein